MAKDKKTRLLEELIQDPASASTRAEEMKRLDLDPAAIGPSAATAKRIADDPDGADRVAEFAGLPFPVKLALLERLGREGAGAFLARLQREEKDKAMAKAIARALHLVRAQGMNVTDLRDRSAVKFDFAAEGLPSSYVSGLDTEGNRLVLVAKVSPVGKLHVFHAVVGDTTGLQNFEGMALTRAAYKKFITMAEAQMQVQLAPMPTDYAAWMVAYAARVATDAGLPVPAAFEDGKAILGAPSEAPPHPIGGVLDVSGIAKETPALVAKSASLHRLPECAFWVPDEATLEKLSERVKEADASPVAANEEQRAQLRDRAGRAVLQEYLDDKNRGLWSGRLLETAYVLAATGRTEEARIAVATATALAAEKADVESIPFATELVDKIVRQAGAIDPHAGHAHATSGLAAEMRAAGSEAPE